MCKDATFVINIPRSSARCKCLEMEIKFKDDYITITLGRTRIGKFLFTSPEAEKVTASFVTIGKLLSSLIEDTLANKRG